LQCVRYHDGAPQTSPLCAAWIGLVSLGWTAGRVAGAPCCRCEV